MTEFDTYEFDVSSQPLMQWFTARLKHNRRDKIDALGRRLISDRRLPRSASLSMYRAQLASKKYSEQDIQTFLSSWQEMREETESEG